MPRRNEISAPPNLGAHVSEPHAGPDVVQLASEVRALRQALFECQRQTQALLQAEDFHRIVLENVSDAVFLTDERDEFTFVCPNCDVIFGFSRNEVAALGSISTLLGAHGSAPPQLGNGHAINNHECQITTKSGTRRTLLVHVKRVSIGAGARLYVCRDITERKQAELAAAAAHDEIHRLSKRLAADNCYLRREVEQQYNHDAIIGRSPAIRRVLQEIDQVAHANSTVLLLGETGTGKELVARAIHSRSPRHPRPMVTLNCAALPAALIESELFGREEGAYTGAMSRQIGRFEHADGSTLFLDEVGELPLETQAKLLRVLQSGEFERLGSTKPRMADVRIVAATNRDLEQRVREGAFRQDLYYRLNVFPIRVPPLRERMDDVPLLVQSFVQEFSRTMKKVIDAVPQSALDALLQHNWPGNIRELRNVIERAMIVSQGDILAVEAPRAGHAEDPALPSDATLDDVERNHIRAILAKTGWRISGPRGAAAALGVKPTTLEYRMHRLGIVRPGSSQS